MGGVGKHKRTRPDVEETGKVLREAFLRNLAECGQVRPACVRAGLCKQAVYQYRDRHPEFAAAWVAAIESYYEKQQKEIDEVEKVFFEKAKSGDINAALALLKAWRPNRYDRPKKVEQKNSGEVEHTHQIKVIRMTTVETHDQYKKLLADRAKLAGTNGNGNGKH